MSDDFPYTGPAVPIAWDPGWQRFTNLTPAQIAIFQSFPQDLSRYLSARRRFAEQSGLTVNGIPLTTQLEDQAKIAQLKQAFDNGALIGTVDFFDATGNVQQVDGIQATAIYNAVVSFVQSTYSAAATMAGGIKGGTVNKRSQIDAALAAVAPNSPSATNPSPI